MVRASATLMELVVRSSTDIVVMVSGASMVSTCTDGAGRGCQKH